MVEDGFVKDCYEYQQPSEVEREVIQRVGYTEEFLSMLQRSHLNISETRLYVLAPDYVATEAGKTFVGRAAWRSSFSGYAGSSAGGRGVGIHDGLRGVRLVVVPAGDAPKNVEVPSAPLVITPVQCYNALLADEKGAIAALDDSRAAGLSRILAGYLATKVQ